jgi:ankyrin repeat protein
LLRQQLIKIEVILMTTGYSTAPTSLAEDIEAGETQKVEKFLKENQKFVNSRFPRGHSPLELAASIGNAEMVAVLIDAKANVKTTNAKGEPPLFFTVGTGKERGAPVVECLLKAKADPNHRRLDGWSPLGLASFAGNAASVDKLLEYKADPDQTITNGATPTWLAAQENHADVIEVLAKHRADLEKIDNEGVSPLWKAAKTGNKAAVQWLLHLKADPNGNSGVVQAPPLCMAVSNDFIEVSGFLLEAKADPDGPPGFNPLFLACKNQNENIIKLLIAHHADASLVLDMKVPTGLPESNIALLKNALQTSAVVSQLGEGKNKKKNKKKETSSNATTLSAATLAPAIKANPAVDLSKIKPTTLSAATLAPAIKANPAVDLSKIKPTTGRDPVPENLGALIEVNNLDEVIALIVNGGHKFDINSRFPRGFSALELAASLCNAEMVAVLVHAKANVKATNDKGETPLFFCVGTGKENGAPAVECLLKAKADPNHMRTDGWSPLCLSSFAGNAATVTKLLEYNADPDQTIANGATPVWLAAQENHADVIQVLAKHGADLDKTDNEGVSPLWKAAKTGHKAAVQWLLKLKADPDSKSSIVAAPPLCMAVSGDFVEVSGYLLEAKADPDGPPGFNPLFLACKNGNETMIKLLIAHHADASLVLDMKAPTGLPKNIINFLKSCPPPAAPPAPAPKSNKKKKDKGKQEQQAADSTPATTLQAASLVDSSSSVVQTKPLPLSTQTKTIPRNASLTAATAPSNASSTSAQMDMIARGVATILGETSQTSESPANLKPKENHSWKEQEALLRLMAEAHNLLSENLDTASFDQLSVYNDSLEIKIGAIQACSQSLSGAKLFQSLATKTIEQLQLKIRSIELKLEGVVEEPLIDVEADDEPLNPMVLFDKIGEIKILLSKIGTDTALLKEQCDKLLEYKGGLVVLSLHNPEGELYQLCQETHKEVASKIQEIKVQIKEQLGQSQLLQSSVVNRYSLLPPVPKQDLNPVRHPQLAGVVTPVNKV